MKTYGKRNVVNRRKDGETEEHQQYDDKGVFRRYVRL